MLGIGELRYYFLNREFNNVSYTTYFQKKVMCQSISKLFKEMLTLEEDFSHLKPTFFHKLIEKRFNSAM